MHGNETRLAELGHANGQHALVPINIGTRQVEGLGNAKAGAGEKAEKSDISVWPELLAQQGSIARWREVAGRRQYDGQLRFRINMGRGPEMSWTQETGGRNFGRGIEDRSILGKA